MWAQWATVLWGENNLSDSSLWNIRLHTTLFSKTCRTCKQAQICNFNVRLSWVSLPAVRVRRKHCSSPAPVLTKCASLALQCESLAPVCLWGSLNWRIDIVSYSDAHRGFASPWGVAGVLSPRAADSFSLPSQPAGPKQQTHCWDWWQGCCSPPPPHHKFSTVK